MKNFLTFRRLKTQSYSVTYLEVDETSGEVDPQNEVIGWLSVVADKMGESPPEYLTLVVLPGKLSHEPVNKLCQRIKQLEGAVRYH